MWHHSIQAQLYRMTIVIDDAHRKRRASMKTGYISTASPAFRLLKLKVLNVIEALHSQFTH